jgi:hypothetical protein
MDTDCGGNEYRNEGCIRDYYSPRGVGDGDSGRDKAEFRIRRAETRIAKAAA